MTRPRRHKQLRSLRKATRKRVDHVAADFIATWTSRSADGRAQVFCARAILLSQTLHTGNHRRRQRTPPTSMHRRKRTRPRIANQNRHTIGRLYAGQHVLGVADDHVAIDRFAELIFRRLRFRRKIHHAHVRAMYLPATRQRPLARKQLEKATAILQNVLRSVVVKTREAERILRHWTNATLT